MEEVEQVASVICWGREWSVSGSKGVEKLSREILKLRAGD
jgi:hypothetical protein